MSTPEEPIRQNTRVLEAATSLCRARERGFLCIHARPLASQAWLDPLYSSTSTKMITDLVLAPSLFRSFPLWIDTKSLWIGATCLVLATLIILILRRMKSVRRFWLWLAILGFSVLSCYGVYRCWDQWRELNKDQLIEIVRPTTTGSDSVYFDGITKRTNSFSRAVIKSGGKQNFWVKAAIHNRTPRSISISIWESQSFAWRITTLKPEQIIALKRENEPVFILLEGDMIWKGRRHRLSHSADLKECSQLDCEVYESRDAAADSPFGTVNQIIEREEGSPITFADGSVTHVVILGRNERPVLTFVPVEEPVLEPSILDEGLEFVDRSEDRGEDEPDTPE